MRPEVVEALGKLARGGGNMDARANAARALGILRGKAAVPDLMEAAAPRTPTHLRIAGGAAEDPRQSAAPRIAFLLRDFDPKVQLAAMETTGLLQKQGGPAGPDGRAEADADTKVKRAALTAIAMLPDKKPRDYARYLTTKTTRCARRRRKGYARLHKPADLPMLEKAWEDETKPSRGFRWPSPR